MIHGPAYVMPEWALVDGNCRACGEEDMGHAGTCPWSLMRSGRVWAAMPGSEDVWMSDDRELIDWARVYELLTGTYWGDDYTPNDVDLRKMNSKWRLAMYVNDEPGDRESRKLIGYLRVVTDEVAIAYLADVVIAREWQGLGAGTAMMNRTLEQWNVDWLLHTVDAHLFYGRFGFEPRGEVLMERRRRRGTDA